MSKNLYYTALWPLENLTNNCNQNGIYIGIRCFSSEPGTVIANTMEHDRTGGRNEDRLSILLDPFQDKRSAYIFIVNPKGARSEGFATGENYTLGWDGLWEAKCQIDREVLPADFEVAEGVVIPKDDYRYVNYHIGTSTASYRKFQCYLDYSFGGFYSGNYNNIQTGVNLQLDGYVKLQVGANMVRGHLPGFI